jgi:predicted ArsR family transcriptional regulator
MTTDTKPTATIKPAAPIAKPPRKSALVLKLLTRAKGATLAEITEPTGWQPHSARAHLSNLRKQGRSVVREQRKSGETAYRVVDAACPAASAAVAPVADADATTNPATA